MHFGLMFFDKLLSESFQSGRIIYPSGTRWRRWCWI